MMNGGPPLTLRQCGVPPVTPLVSRLPGFAVSLARSGVELLVFVFRGDAVFQRACEPVGERAGGVVPAEPEQLVPRGDLDEYRDAPPGGDGHADQWHLEAQNLVKGIV